MVQLSNYIYEEEKREEDELASLVFYFEEEEQLCLHIKSNWGSNHFMKELLTFLDQANYCKSETLQQRSILVCNTIAQAMLFESEGKSWFWKFRHILYELEEFFLDKNIEKEGLSKIYYYYIRMNDFHRAQKLLVRL